MKLQDRRFRLFRFIKNVLNVADSIFKILKRRFFMYKYLGIIALVFFVIFSTSQIVTSASKVTDTSEQSEVSQNPADQISLESGAVYSATAASDGDIQIMPLDYLELNLSPVIVEFTAHSDELKIYEEIETFNKFNGTGDVADAALGSMSYSAMFETASNDWYWAYNHEYNGILDLLNSRKEAGFRIESFDVYPDVDNASSKYAATWVKDGQGWAWALNYESDDFLNLLETYKNEGRRITDLEFDKRSRNWGGVWISDTKAWRWAINYSYNDFLQLLNEQKNEGNRPLDLNIYPNASGSAFLYAGVWCGNPEQHGWAYAFNYSWSDFSDLLDQYHADGYRLIDYEKYMASSGMLYGGLWFKDGVGGGYSINYSDQAEFSGRIQSRKDDDSMRPMKFEMYTDLATSVAKNEPQKVKTFELSQNYPNPFNPQTTINYSIPSNGVVRLKVYNLQGQEVETLVNKQQQPGQYSVPFLASDLVSGIYVYRLEFDGESSFVKTRKMSFLK
jgi:hypothetical protein